ncbi:Hypothetical predicted protein [Podarcis lilfordi]|uniref:Uncharacterized protein n=1 Tax=Podarcis lilfordi TaxID=74358 RepID=A0AA35QQD6_9SAUR|nr:Hypothetical predicted protein [Podarcis lilfordi]
MAPGSRGLRNQQVARQRCRLLLNRNQAPNKQTPNKASAVNKTPNRLDAAA